MAKFRMNLDATKKNARIIKSGPWARFLKDQGIHYRVLAGQRVFRFVGRRAALERFAGFLLGTAIVDVFKVQ